MNCTNDHMCVACEIHANYLDDQHERRSAARRAFLLHPWTGIALFSALSATWAVLLGHWAQVW